MRENDCDTREFRCFARMGPEEYTTLDAQEGRPAGLQQAKRRGATYPLRVGRSPLEWILANGKAPTLLPTSEKLLLNASERSEDPEWERRVSASRGWAGEKSDFFSILLKEGTLTQ